MAPKFIGLVPYLSVLSGLFCLLPSSSASPAQLNRRALPPFGVDIFACTQPGVLALSFDDGPWTYTPGMLDKMEAQGVKATWFVNGQNRASIFDYASTIVRMDNLGHQVGSHTWSHKDLTKLSLAQQVAEMTQLEDALMTIMGKFPYYMRPPFLGRNASVLQTMADLEYVVIIGNLNTRDWAYQSETAIEQSKTLFVNGWTAGGSIAELHDPEPFTASVLVDFVLEYILNNTITTVTVAECLGQSNKEDWYRTTRLPKPSSTTPTATPTTTTTTAPTSTSTVTISPNGRCGLVQNGLNLGYTCPTGKCCSKWGYCGTTSEYCTPANCQPQYGRCDGAAPTGSITPDGTCGNVQNGQNKGYICPTGQCCSRYGWCGTASGYCGTGCQTAFGTCPA